MDHPADPNQGRSQDLTPAASPAAELISADLPREGKLAGIDFGTVRIGIATTDPTQHWTTPLETYTRQAKHLETEYFRRLTREEKIVGFVIGLPVHNDGQESAKSKQVRHFAQWLGELTERPVALFDERFTSSHASQMLIEAGVKAAKRKGKIDQIAAHLILQGYLESARSSLSQPQALNDPPSPA